MIHFLLFLFSCTLVSIHEINTPAYYVTFLYYFAHFVSFLLHCWVTIQL